MAVPTTSTPARTWPTIDQMRRLNASCGVPNSGRRVCRSVKNTGSAVSASTTPVTIRSAVPWAWEMCEPDSSHQRGRTNRK